MFKKFLRGMAHLAPFRVPKDVARHTDLERDWIVGKTLAPPCHQEDFTHEIVEIGCGKGVETSSEEGSHCRAARKHEVRESALG